MTTAPSVPPSLSRLHSERASPFPRSSVRTGAGVAFSARPYGSLLSLRSPVMSASGVGSPVAPEDSTVSCRLGEVKRVTKETNVHVKVNLDGTGVADCSTGVPFLDHMLDQLASHGLFDVYVRASGDTHIDDHHSNEDIALAIGTALLQALGDRKGINRFGHFTAPLDEAAVEVILDLSGRPHLSCGLSIPTARVGTYDTQLVEHFFQSLVNTSGMTLHIRQLAGNNSHHIIEAYVSKHLPGPFDKQQNTTYADVALCQLQRCSVKVVVLLQDQKLDARPPGAAIGGNRWMVSYISVATCAWSAKWLAILLFSGFIYVATTGIMIGLYV